MQKCKLSDRGYNPISTDALHLVTSLYCCDTYIVFFVDLVFSLLLC